MKKVLSAILIGAFVFAAFGTAKADDNGFVASKNSDKYHLPACSMAKKIDAANKVVFKTPEEAIKAGYSPCKICNPPTKSAAFVASKGSDKYHVPTCRYVGKIKPENLVSFATKEEAEKAGYSPCKVCIK